MKVLLVEDDPSQADWITAEIERGIPGAVVSRIKTEFEFRSRFEEITQEPPDLVVIDVMLRWTDPSPNIHLPPKDVRNGGFHRAGIRCKLLLAEDGRTQGIPVIFYSVLDPVELGTSMKAFGDVGPLLALRKDTDSTELILAIRSFGQALGVFRDVKKGPRKKVEQNTAILPTRSSGMAPASAAVLDRRRVFVIYGRNSMARNAIFDFLRAIDLAPMEWEEVIAATHKPSPFIGEALAAAFSIAQAAVVVLTGDDVARLGKRYLKPTDNNDERALTPQPRPNVIFEAGMAFGMYPDRTVLVSIGSYRKFSDIDGRHIVCLSNNAQSRHAFADRLRHANCDLKTDYKGDWLNSGNFDAAIQDPDVNGGGGRARLKMFKREYRFDPNAVWKRKIWIELKNESDECLLLRNPYWKSVPGGIHATIRAGTFQLQLGNTWCPENIGAQQVNLPPGDLCRLWAEPDEELHDAQLKQLCRSDTSMGSVVLGANAEEITVLV